MHFKLCTTVNSAIFNPPHQGICRYQSCARDIAHNYDMDFW